MPTPKKGERKKKFIKRCIPYMYENEPETLTSKDKKNKQAYAVCNSIYDRSKKKSKKNESYNPSKYDNLKEIRCIRSSHNVTKNNYYKIVDKKHLKNDDFLFTIIGDNGDEIKFSTSSRFSMNFDIHSKISESIDVYTEDILNDVMGFLNLKQPPLFDEAIELLNEFIDKNPDNKRAKELLYELKAIDEYNRKDVEEYHEFYERVINFTDFLKESATSEPLDDEYDWEEEGNYEDAYNKFTGWLYEKGFDFYDGEEDFREEFDNIIDDSTIDKEEKAFQITRFLEDKWGLYDGWNEVYEKLIELL